MPDSPFPVITPSWSTSGLFFVSLSAEADIEVLTADQLRNLRDKITTALLPRSKPAPCPDWCDDESHAHRPAPRRQGAGA
jgi:hypothetical protein